MATHEVSRKFETFQEAFCHRFGCAPERFGRKTFFKAVSAVKLPLVLPLFLVFPERFDLDLDIIEQAGKTRTKEEFSQILDEFHNAMRVERSKLKKFLGMRMSGARLMDLRDELDPWIEKASVTAKTMARVGPVAATPAEKTPVAARAPTESRALLSRKLRLTHAAVVDGKPLEEALSENSLTESQFRELLAGEAETTPAYAWLERQLSLEEKLKEANGEIDRLGRAVADQSREIADLRSRVAPEGAS